jgi:drug/metabolite transporter (DMT)-like permease
MSVLPALLAALSAVLWGTGDFCGGKATRRSSALAVTVLSQLAGLPVLAGCVAIFGGVLTWSALGWGAGAGLAGVTGINLLYRGLSQGAMAIFAPVTAVTAAVVPLLFGLLTQHFPGTVPLIGAACAVVAIGLVSLTGGHSPVSPVMIGLALAAGFCFGVFFILIAHAGHGAGIWPVVGARTTAVLAALAAALATRTSLVIAPTALRWAVVAGSFDLFANALYVLAARDGQLAVVAPIASLYPVSTVLLALLVDRERVRPVQLAGLGMAATALVLVSV